MVLGERQQNGVTQARPSPSRSAQVFRIGSCIDSARLRVVLFRNNLPIRPLKRVQSRRRSGLCRYRGRACGTVLFIY
jgi:hypothetical protein